MVATKTNKLRGAWTDTKITMLEWIQNTIRKMPDGEKASDVRDMVNAAGALIKLVGDMGPEQQDQEEVKLSLGDANRAIKNGLNQFKDASKLFFGEVDEEDDNEEVDND